MEIVVRALVVYVLLWVLLRAMGKRELAEMTAFELVLLVVIGDLVQQGVTQDDRSLTGVVLAIAPMALLIMGTSFVTARSARAAEVLEGKPTVVVRAGEPLTGVLDAERIPVHELLQAARADGISDLADVEWCILEPDGRFSFVPKQDTSS
ncbi:MAG TPA: YetF domain-containing protein [Acidimicrobiales bacterium]